MVARKKKKEKTVLSCLRIEHLLLEGGFAFS